MKKKNQSNKYPAFLCIKFEIHIEIKAPLNYRMHQSEAQRRARARKRAQNQAPKSKRRQGRLIKTKWGFKRVGGKVETIKYPIKKLCSCKAF